MDSSKRFKLYKKGKLWLTAAICTLALGLGCVASQSTAEAAASYESSPTTTASTPTNQLRNRFYNQNGQTYYYDNAGNQLRNSWYSLHGHQYYFGNDGVLVTNKLVTINGNTYQFDGGGVMQRNNFTMINGNVYYYGNNGARYTNQWYENGGHQYYFGANGQLVTNQNVSINGTDYHFDGNGLATRATPVVPSSTNNGPSHSPYISIRRATPASMGDLSARGLQLVNANRDHNGTNFYPISILGGYDNITTHSGYFNNDNNAVSSENQLPLDFTPGILAYDPDHDTSEVIGNAGLTPEQEMRLNDLSNQWMNSLRYQYWNVVQPQNHFGSRFVGRTHDSRHHWDNTPNGRSTIQPLVTTVDFWHNVGGMIGAEREAVKMTYDHTDSFKPYDGHPFYFEGHQHVYQPFTTVIANEIANVFKPTAKTRADGRGWRFGENLYDLQGKTMLQMEVNLYNKMQVMLWGEYVQYQNGTVGNGSHLVNAIDPQAQLVTMGFQRIANNGDNPHYYVLWEFYGATDTTTLSGPNSAAYAYGTADTRKNNNMRTYDGLINTGVVDKIRSAQG